jgi:hypothetical protein
MAKTKILARERRIALGLDVDRKVAVVVALDVTKGKILFQGRREGSGPLPPTAKRTCGSFLKNPE